MTLMSDVGNRAVDAAGGVIADRTAMAAYRQRLADRDDEATATHHNDIGQIERLALDARRCWPHCIT